MVKSKQLYVLTFLCVFLSNAFAIQDIGRRVELFKVDKVTVKGLKKVEKEAVLEKIKARPGVMLDNYSDIKVGDIIETFEEISTNRKL